MQTKHLLVGYLSQPVEWEPRQQNIWKEFNGAEVCIDYPVCQSFGVIFLIAGFNGLDGFQCWVDKSNKIAEQLSSICEIKYKAQNTNETYRSTMLGWLQVYTISGVTLPKTA